MMKKDAKAWLIRWILLLQEFNLKIWDKKDTKNVVADHLSRFPNSPCNELPINDDFPDEKLLVAFRKIWFADIVNYLVTNQAPSHWLKQDVHRFLYQVRYVFWEGLYLFKCCSDQIIRRCILMRKLRVFYLFVMSLHTVDTLVLARLLKKCYKVGSIGPLCLKILMNFARCTLNANGRKDFKIKYDAPQPNSRNRTLWCLGHWLYGSIS